MANVNIKLLQLAAKFTLGVFDERGKYCDHVFIEPSPEGGVLIVALNYYCMAVLHDHGGKISRKIAVKIDNKKLKNSDHHIEFNEHNQLQQGPILVANAKPLNWRKIVMDAHDLPDGSGCLSFDWRKLKKICKAVEVFGGNTRYYPTIIQSKDGPMVVKFDTFINGFFLLMPCISDGPTVPVTADDMGLFDGSGEA